ncbi:MAG TPA: hypothetical protein EYQ02_13770, partial [Microbacterium sp.]|nr:hypothetical protein [Microbacterium sp.]
MRHQIESRPHLRHSLQIRWRHSQWRRSRPRRNVCRAPRLGTRSKRSGARGACSVCRVRPRGRHSSWRKCLGPLRHSLAALMAIGLSPLAAAALLVRPRLRHGLGERLGRIDWSAEESIWVHASSVGEAKAATRLLRALGEAGHRVRASASTLPGREIFRRDLPSLDSSLAPLDHPWCVEAAIGRGRPRLSVLIETELWPSWIAACARHAVPVVVASGRLSDRSFPRYRKLRRLMGPTLRRVAAVGARTDLDADRFVELGVPEARVRVTGDLKLDPPSDQPALAIDLIRALSDAPVVIGGSTHPGEERALLAGMDSAEKAGHGFILVL